MVSRLRTAAILAVMTLSLAACTSDTTPVPTPSATGSTDPDAAPTPGTLVGRDAFAVTLPKGWGEQTKDAGALLLGISSMSVDGYPTNVNVVEDTTLAQVAPEQLEAARVAVLTAPGASAFTQVTSEGDYEVDGEQGVRLTYEHTLSGLDVRSDEVTVTHADAGYIITFSFAPSVAKTERDAVVDTIMDTWTWAL